MSLNILPTEKKQMSMPTLRPITAVLALLLAAMVFPAKTQGADYLVANSLNRTYNNYKPDKSLIFPWSKHVGMVKILKDGVYLQMLEPIRLDESEWVEEGLMRKLPDLYYAVIRYMDLGTYYGFIEVRGINTSLNDYMPLAGKLITNNNDTINIVRDIEMCLNPQTPSGTYYRYVRDHYLQADYYDESPNQEGTWGICDYVAQYTFGPGGKFKFTYGADYSDQTPQVSAGEYTYRQHGRRNTVTDLTGGWYYDVKSSLSTTGTWKYKDGVLSTDISKATPTYTCTANLNTDLQRKEWAQDDKWRGDPDPQVKVYRNQLLQQQKRDFPNYMSNAQKKLMLRTLKEMNLEKKQAFVIVGAGGNDMFALPLHSDDFTRVAHFQKKGDASFRYDREDVEICYSQLANIYTRKLRTICENIPELLKKKFSEGTEIQVETAAGQKPYNVVDWYVYDFTPALDSAKAVFILREANSTELLPFTAELSLGYIKAEIQPGTLSQYTNLERKKQAYLANYNRIEQYRTNKEFKNAKKRASQYKKTNKKPIPFTYATITQFLDLDKLLSDKIKEQETAIAECEALLKN